MGWTRHLAATVLALSVGAAGSATSAEPAPEDTPHKMLILLPPEPNPAEREAAEVLEHWLAQVPGTATRITSELPAPGADGPPRLVLSVGRTALAAGEPDLAPEEIHLARRDGVLLIRGGDLVGDADVASPATVMAAYELLRALGFAWLWPGASGTLIPAELALEAVPTEHRYQPPLALRVLRGPRAMRDRGLERAWQHRAAAIGADFDAWFARHREDTLAWLARQGVAHRSSRPPRRINYRWGHAFIDWYDRYAEEHPDWFALQPDGTRTQPRSWTARLCVSNEALIDEIIRAKVYELRQSNLDAVSIAPNDGGPGCHFCMDEACKALDVPEAPMVKLPGWGEYPSLTDRYVWFFNRIAKGVTAQIPDAVLTTYAYDAYALPPAKRKLLPAIALQFVPGTYLSESARAGLRDYWNSWAGMGAQRLFWRPNFMHGGHGFPVLYPHRLAADMSHFADHGMQGADFDRLIGHWATQGLNYALAARLLWDPHTDPDAFIETYCQRGFGPAAEPVRTYFHRLTAITDQLAEQDVSESFRSLRVRSFVEAVPSAYLAFAPEGQQLLAQARAAAADRPDVLERIAFLKAGLDYTVLQSRVIQAVAAQDRAALEDLMPRFTERKRALATEMPHAIDIYDQTLQEDAAWERNDDDLPYDPDL